MTKALFPGSAWSRFMSRRAVHLVLLLAVSALLSVWLHEIYLPWWAGDSATYSTPAWGIYFGKFGGYPGMRTPAYPLFLLGCEWLAGSVDPKLSPQAGDVVTWVQSILGVISVLLVYLSMEKLLIRPWLSFVLSLLFALLIAVAQFQMIILCESLCIFFVVLSTYLATLTIERFRRGLPLGSLALLTGVAFGSAILVRPNVIFLWVLFMAAIPALIGIKLLRREKFDSDGVVKDVARPCLAGGALLMMVWLFANYENTGFVTLTTMLGLTRSGTAYNLFDQVHPEDKVLGDIMVKYDQLTNRNGATNHAYIWIAMPEIYANADKMPIHHVDGRSRRVELFQYVGSVSSYLLREHPGIWAENSLSDLGRTFDFHLPQTLPGELMDPVSLAGTPVIVDVNGWKMLSTVEAWEAWLILPLYLLTFAAAAMATPRALAAPNLRTALIPLTVSAFAFGVLICMATPSILATYDNRYSVPLIPLFAICSAYVLEALLQLVFEQNAKPTDFPIDSPEPNH